MTRLTSSKPINLWQIPLLPPHDYVETISSRCPCILVWRVFCIIVGITAVGTVVGWLAGDLTLTIDDDHICSDVIYAWHFLNEIVTVGIWYTRSWCSHFILLWNLFIRLYMGRQANVINEITLCTGRLLVIMSMDRMCVHWSHIDFVVIHSEQKVRFVCCQTTTSAIVPDIVLK